MPEDADQTMQLHPAVPKLSRNYSFHFLWGSTFASGFADRLAMLSVMVMLGYGVADQAGKLGVDFLEDAQITAGSEFWFFLPYVLWGPIAGWLADKLPRKWLMFAADEGRAVIILFAFFLLEEGRTGPIAGLYETWFTVGGLAFTHTWKIWGLMFAVGMLAATFSPARTSIIPNVVGVGWLQRANATITGMGVIGNLIGFLIGGPLLEDSLRWCILISALCYGLSGLVWPFLKTPAKAIHDPELRIGVPRRSGPMQSLVEILEGARYTFAHRPVFILACVGVLFWSGTSIVMAAGAVIASSLYGGEIAEFTQVAGAFGFGMLGGAILLGFLNARRGGETLITISLIFTAIFLSLLVSVPIKWLGIIIAFCSGTAGGVLLISITTMIQQLTPDWARGRVIAFKEMAADIGKVGVALAIWQMPGADRAMIPLTYLLSGCLVIAGILGYWYYMRRGPFPGHRMNVIYRLALLYLQGMHRLKRRGAERIPQSGPVLLVANHNAGLDPIALQACVPRHVRFIMARDQRSWLLEWFWRIWQPIYVQGSTGDTRDLKKAVAVLREGGAVGIFPEGGLNPDREQLRDFGAGAALLARRGRATIIPVWIEGQPEAQSVYGSLLKLSHTSVTFGEPFQTDDVPEGYDGQDESRTALTAYLKDQLAALRDRVRSS